VKIKYRKIDDETRSEGVWFYPLLQVFLRTDVSVRPVLALVDSGSSDCVFSASVGEVLGIEVRAGKPYGFHAFDLNEVRGFIHKVRLQVTGFAHWIEIDAVFVESEVIPILGQQGFFESYQVVFERFSRQFEINTKSDAIVRNSRGYRGRRR
jgi:hypothetical protein